MFWARNSLALKNILNFSIPRIKILFQSYSKPARFAQFELKAQFSF